MDQTIIAIWTPLVHFPAHSLFSIHKMSFLSWAHLFYSVQVFRQSGLGMVGRPFQSRVQLEMHAPQSSQVFPSTLGLESSPFPKLTTWCQKGTGVNSSEPHSPQHQPAEGPSRDIVAGVSLHLSLQLTLTLASCWPAGCSYMHCGDWIRIPPPLRLLYLNA